MKKTLQLLLLITLLVVFLFLGKNKLAAFYYNRGNDFYEQHVYKEAIGYFNKAIRLNPDIAGIHYSLGNAYLEEKLEEQAIKEYTKAIQLDNRFIWSYKALAHIYLGRGSYQEALEILKKAAGVIPNDPEIKDLAGDVAYEYKASLINSGVDAFLVKDKAKAHALLDQALQIDPDFIFARYLSGYFYYSEHKYVEAENMLKEAVRLNNQSFLAHSLLGDIYFEKKDFLNASREYKAARSLNSKDPVLLNNLGLACMNMENYNEALLFLKEAAHLEPENVNIRYSLASVYRDNGRLQDAVVEYENVIRTRPDYPNAHNDLGDIYKQLGQEAQAVEEYNKEIRYCQAKLSSKPGDFVLLNNIAHAYNGIGEYDLAKEFIDKALTVQPDYREAYLTLAGVYKNLGNATEALAALEKANALSSQKYSFIEREIKDAKQLRLLMKDKISSR